MLTGAFKDLTGRINGGFPGFHCQLVGRHFQSQQSASPHLEKAASPVCAWGWLSLLGWEAVGKSLCQLQSNARSVFTSTEHLGSCAPPCLTLELQNPVTSEPMEISVPNDRMWSHRLDSIQRESPKAVKEFDEVTLWRMFSQMLPSTESGSRTKQRCECFVLRKTQCTCLSTFSRVKPFLEKKRSKGLILEWGEGPITTVGH